ncbi:MAG: serine/threonine protein kinase [Planctomycetes bacterium]|nr:serine/threonine protein kinase [Planctomycetota bacterium]
MSDSGNTIDDGRTPDGEYEFDELDDPLAPLANGTGAPPLVAGDTLLGRFKLLRRFQISGQSEVWAAWAVRERRFVVLKFVHARLLEEARRATNVPDGVVVVHEYNSDVEGKPFLVLEYALGGAADRYARAWTTNPALLVRKFLPVVRTLAKAHARGTVHCDLKPSNLLLWAEPPHVRADEDPMLPEAGSDPTAMQIRVADWGLAISNEEGESRTGGTPGFAAPEQWRGEVAPAADVFGLAATLYYLLANPPDTPQEKLRFAAPATREAVAGLLAGRSVDFGPAPIHEINPKVDPRLSRVIMTSLAADPGERHTSADALADELERWLNGQAVRGDSRGRRLELWVRRNRAWVAATTLAVAALAGLAGWAVVSKLDAAKSRADVAEKERDANESDKRRAQADALSAKLQVKLVNERNSAEYALWTSRMTAAARAAVARGDWPTALGMYDELVRGADPAKARLLRVERLFGYFDTNNEAALLAELKALEADPDLGPAAAWVKLVRGEHLLCDMEGATRGRVLIKEALEGRKKIPADQRDKLFTPADVFYAEALLETRPRPALEKLCAAVKANSLHYQAHKALVAATAFRPLGLPVPTVNLLFRQETDAVYKESLRVVENLGDPALREKLDAINKRLAALVADDPEALGHALLAANLFAGGATAMKADNAADCRTWLKAAAEQAHRAASQPTLTPRAPVRYTARFTEVISDVMILKLIPDADPVHSQRVHDYLPRLIADGRGKWSDQLDRCAELTIRVVTDPLSPKLKAEWKTDTPAGRAAYRDRNRQLYRVSRYFLDTWAEEVMARPEVKGDERRFLDLNLADEAKKSTEAKTAALRSQLEAWAEAEGLNVPIAPPPRPK